MASRYYERAHRSIAKFEASAKYLNILDVLQNSFIEAAKSLKNKNLNSFRLSEANSK